MSFAKGRTNCEAERDTTAQGFRELLEALKRAKNQVEVEVKAELYDIINDKSLSEQERRERMKPFEDVLTEQEESDIRIRRTILIGLFSFWELSLKDLCKYYKINVTKIKSSKKESKSKNVPIFGENDYLNAIFRDIRPKNIGLISSQIRELRNYMTHGSAYEDRQATIDSIISSYPELCVAKSGHDYFISSYDGLDKMLQIINDGLTIAEKTARTLNVQTN